MTPRSTEPVPTYYGRVVPVCTPLPPPDTADLQTLVQRIAERLGRMLEGRGLIERDAESAWLSGDPGEAATLDDLIGHSITYRIAVGPRAGRKPRADALRAGALPAQNPVPRRHEPHRARAAGPDGAVGGAGAAAADAPDEVSRRVRAAQQVTRRDHADGARAGRDDTAEGRGAQRHSAPRRDELRKASDWAVEAATFSPAIDTEQRPMSAIFQFNVRFKLTD